MPARFRARRRLGLALAMLFIGGFSLSTITDAPLVPVEIAHATGPADAKPAPPQTLAPLGERLDALLDKEFLADAQVGVCVVDLRDGTTVYERNPGLPLNPASNVKLVTTAAALEILGPEHRFATRVLIDPDDISKGTVSGPVYLQGSGDPSLVTGELYELATRLKAAGIERINGPIIVDSTRFDSDGLPPGFDQKDEFASYRAPGGATSVNFNTYEVRARPGSAIGEKPIATTMPRVDGIVLSNEAKTVAGHRNKLTVHVEDDNGKVKVFLRGEIGESAGPGTYRYPVPRPSHYSGEAFRTVLKQAGIKVAKKPVKVGDAPTSAKVMVAHRSEPVSVLIRSINKLSNNFMAEQLLRTLVPEDGATAQASLDALTEYARGTGMPATGLRLGNGSGLYDNNRVTAEQMTHLLAHMYGDFRYRSDFIASLAVAGTEGTLRKRLKESPARQWVRGKTGTLDGVSALSGYAGAQGETPYAFAIFMNDLGRWETGAARKVQNAVAEQLSIEASARGSKSPDAAGG